MKGHDSTVGYDLVTGLGTIDIANLINDWAAVSFAPTTITLELNGGVGTVRAVHGSSISASVAVASTSGSPTGGVSLVGAAADGSVYLGSLAGGAVSGSVNTLPGGNYAVTAHYEGDSQWASSDSSAVAVNISPEASTTKISRLNYDPWTGALSSANSVPYGSLVIFRTDVSGKSGFGVATGSVALTDNGKTLDAGEYALNSQGSTEDITGSLLGGKHTLGAAYSGDASFTAGTTTDSFTVTPAQMTCTLWINTWFARPGWVLMIGGNAGYYQPAVVPPNATTVAPTGTISIYSGTTRVMGPIVVTAHGGGVSPPEGPGVTFELPDAYIAQAPLPVSELPSPTAPLTAVYSGDSNFAGCTSPAVQLLYETNPIPSVISTLISNTQTIAVGAPLGITTTISALTSAPAYESYPTPTGTVQAIVDGKAFGAPVTLTPAQDLSSASAVVPINTSKLSVGTHLITVSYSGDANYTPANDPGAYPVTVVAALPPTPLQFVSVTPCRVADTRNPTGPFGGPELSADSTREFDIPQSTCGIPPTAVAYSVNLTVVPNGFLSYLTLWPTGQTQPYVSTLNSDGRVKANAAIVPAGSNGGVSVYVTDATQVILDIDGYFVPLGTAPAYAFYPLPPCRIADTRNANGPLGGPFISGGSNRAFPVQSGSCNIPPSASAYSLNVTAVPHKTLNYLASWPTGETQPYVSTLNSSTGAVVANAAIVAAGAGGEVSIFASDDSDVILDVNGYFALPATGGLSLYTVAPCRVVDTRSGSGAFNGVLAVNVEGSACALPSMAQGYVVNATVVPRGSLDYLTLWPDGETQPYVSTLNALDGAITSNMAIVPTTNGSIDTFSSNPTNLILDLSSYFAP